MHKSEVQPNVRKEIQKLALIVRNDRMEKVWKGHCCIGNRIPHEQFIALTRKGAV